MIINNPILPGFRPDPSVCRVGDDYFLVNSSFEYFPGIPIYHSKDLINWTQIGHVLTRPSQLALKEGAPNRIGIYAPTIRYHEGTFYCIVTNVGGNPGGNFYVTAKDPFGEWSEPIFTDFGGIDPSLFFDDDGKVYYTGTDKGIFICEIDIKTGKAIGEKHYEAWGGTGANNPEGPHLYKINGYYYLLLAEGGTELCHMVTVARSKTVYGPYDECPFNPVLTNAGTRLDIKAAGHADLVSDVNGNWWAVCLGIRPSKYPFVHILGRETLLAPVMWGLGWPLIGLHGHVDSVMECAGSALPENDGCDENESFFKPHGAYIDFNYKPGSDVVDEFTGNSLHPQWNFIYDEVPGLVEIKEDGLHLNGNTKGISDDEKKAIICRRQEHFDFIATADLEIERMAEGSEAGITIYMNNRHHYEAFVTCRGGNRYVVLRRRIGSLMAEENSSRYDGQKISLELSATKENYSFAFTDEDGKRTELGSGESQYLSTEAGGCFTGNMIGLYACVKAENTKDSVLVKRFCYKSTK
ncbi:MAG: glycoside hydrolase family 43 protein [Lachnospiraceae bacterium]|nr:glycoside hydrolase family 43 protein [Lachnospiraceae bacterium]